MHHDVAAGLVEFSPDLTEFEKRPNAIVAAEFNVVTTAVEWNRNKNASAIEENVLITERDLEWLHPPQDRVLIIRKCDLAMGRGFLSIEQTLLRSGGHNENIDIRCRAAWQFVCLSASQSWQ